MSGESKPSSMDAQNGSAYSNGQYQPTYPPTPRETDQPEYGEEYGEEYGDERSSAVDYDRSRRNEGGYQNPPLRTSASGQRAAHHQAYTGQAYYFPADQTYAQQPTRYDNNLAFDDDQNGTPANSGYTSQTTHSNSGYYPQQTSAQSHYNTYGNGHSHAQHSEPTRRWSTENSPEERLRLGLPRYESEEQRLAYENAGVQHDQQQQYNNNTQQ